MNVKQGDLAIIIKSIAGNEGKIVKVGKYLGGPLMLGDLTLPNTDYWECTCEGSSLQVASYFKKRIRGTAKTAPLRDAWLRPIKELPEEEKIIKSEFLSV